jgi:HK97 family phage prohead protease
MGFDMSKDIKMSKETAKDLADVMRVFSRTKVTTAVVTKAPTDGSGRFTALVNTYGPPPDLDGDIVSPGAWDQTITEAYVEHPGSLFPVWWAHGYHDPANSIGNITAAASTPKGLVVEGRLQIDHSEKALEVYHALLDGRIREWSVSYNIIREHKGEWEGKACNYLDECSLLEVSACFQGANTFTRTLEVKAANTRTKPVNREALKAFVEVGQMLLRASGETAVTAVTEADPELAHYAKVLDDLEHTKAGPTPDPNAVDQFITETKQELAEKSLDRAEQAAWEGRMGVNMVLDLPPIRVDAKMRPMAVDEASP